MLNRIQDIIHVKDNSRKVHVAQRFITIELKRRLGGLKRASLD